MTSCSHLKCFKLWTILDVAELLRLKGCFGHPELTSSTWLAVSATCRRKRKENRQKRLFQFQQKKILSAQTTYWKFMRRSRRSESIMLSQTLTQRSLWQLDKVGSNKRLTKTWLRKPWVVSPTRTSAAATCSGQICFGWQTTGCLSTWVKSGPSKNQNCLGTSHLWFSLLKSQLPWRIKAKQLRGQTVAGLGFRRRNLCMPCCCRCRKQFRIKCQMAVWKTGAACAWPCPSRLKWCQ